MRFQAKVPDPEYATVQLGAIVFWKIIADGYLKAMTTLWVSSYCKVVSWVGPVAGFHGGCGRLCAKYAPYSDAYELLKIMERKKQRVGWFNLRSNAK